MTLYDHILLPEQVKFESKFSPRGNGNGQRRIPERNREEHALKLQDQFNAVRSQGNSVRHEMQLQSLPVSDGLYVEFSGTPAHDLVYGSLESKDGISLLNVREVVINGRESQTVATVFIPRGKESKFLNKLQKYATEIDARSEKPKNDALIRSIEDIRSAQLYDLWTDDPDKFPTERDDWYEVWIQTKGVDNVVRYSQFKETLTQLGIEFRSSSILEFPERSVFLVKSNRESFVLLLNASDFLAEIRSVSPLVSFFTEQRSFEAQEWNEDLISRTDINVNSNSVVCVIDTGVNNGHPLLNNVIPDSSRDTVIDEGPEDRGSGLCRGHGTQMCGVVTYGDLSKQMSTNARVIIDKHIVSVKILGRVANEIDSWGDLTKQAESKTKIIFPDKQPCYCLAITEIEECRDGKPSSWSAAIDSISAEKKSLFLISSGNIIDFNGSDRNIIDGYPNNNRLKLVLNPAQAWNGLTIGAYTNLVNIHGAIESFGVVAPSGGISPFSRTSGLWKKESLIKPDIMFEGGNLIKTNDANLPFDTNDNLSLLTLNNRFNESGFFDTINATSCATALAANFAGRLQAKYPHLWPESIRGLMIHTAKWTEQMKIQFPAHNKTELAQRLKNCGYGVPNERRAFHSTENGFTFIAQEYMRPFIKERGSSSVKINEMHLFELPWPKEVLQELGDIEVTLRITLSYFVEPAPGEIGWKDKYRYASHGFRFDLNKSDENRRAFSLRINKAVLAEEDEERGRGGDSERWLIGSDNRNKGSVHSDEIRLPAIQLLDCNLIAIYPIGGWWKTRTNLNKYNNRARYSLLVSLDTPTLDVDLYNVVKTQIETLISPAVQVEIPVRV